MADEIDSDYTSLIADCRALRVAIRETCAAAGTVRMASKEMVALARASVERLRQQRRAEIEDRATG